MSRADLTLQLSEITTYFRNEFDKAMKEIGLHGGQVSILLALYEENGSSQVELAAKLGVTAPTISNMIKSLSAAKFVESKRCEIDARVVRIYLTGEAAAIRGELNAKLQLFEESFFSALTETERLMFRQLLLKLKPSEQNEI